MRRHSQQTAGSDAPAGGGGPDQGVKQPGTLADTQPSSASDAAYLTERLILGKPPSDDAPTIENRTACARCCRSSGCCALYGAFATISLAMSIAGIVVVILLNSSLSNQDEQVRGYFLVSVQRFEKYGTLIERYTALIEKVSALTGRLQHPPTPECRPDFAPGGLVVPPADAADDPELRGPVQRGKKLLSRFCANY
eukprot:SAG31_NODE_5638_length_2410_cov_2.118131_2_plen_196_part_00